MYQIAATGSAQFGQTSQSDDVCTPVILPDLQGYNIMCGSWNTIIMGVNTNMALGNNENHEIPTCENKLIRCPFEAFNGATQIALGSHHSIALNSQGVVSVSGDNSHKQLPPHQISDIAQIYAKYDATVLIDTSNRIYLYGYDHDVVTIDISSTNNITQVEIAPEYIDIITETGDDYVYDIATKTITNILHNIVSVASTRYATIVLQSNGCIFERRHKSLIRIYGVEGIPIKLIAGGAHFGCITFDGDCYMWGVGTRGQLGTGSFCNLPQPTKIHFNCFAVRHACAGEEHTVFILDDPARIYNPLPPLMKLEAVPIAVSIQSSIPQCIHPAEFDIKF